MMLKIEKARHGAPLPPIQHILPANMKMNHAVAFLLPEESENTEFEEYNCFLSTTFIKMLVKVTKNAGRA